MTRFRALALLAALAALHGGGLRAGPSVPPVRPPAPSRPAQPRPAPPESIPEGVMIVRPNPNAGRPVLRHNQSVPFITEEIYFHRSDAARWPGAVAEFARDLEAHYLGWLASSGRGPLDEGAALIFDALESGTDLAGYRRCLGEARGEAGDGDVAGIVPAWEREADYWGAEDPEEADGGDWRPDGGGAGNCGGGAAAGDWAYGGGRPPGALRAFLAGSLDALAVDRGGYWHFLPMGGEDEPWRPTGAPRLGGGTR